MFRFFLAGLTTTVEDVWEDSGTSLQFLDQLGMDGASMRRVGCIARNLKDQGMDDPQIKIVLLALFDKSTNRHMNRAFNLFAHEFQPNAPKKHTKSVLRQTSSVMTVHKEVKTIDFAQFRPIAAILGGDEITDDQLEVLFRTADADDSGAIDLDEFSNLMNAMNDTGEKKESFLNNLTTNLVQMQDWSSTGAAQTWTTLTRLDVSTQLQLNPLQLSKVGRAINAMTEAHYSDEGINVVTRAMFLQRPRDLSKAFKVLDEEGKGHISREKFTEVLMLIGEGIPKEMVETLFEHVDADNSNTLDEDEFAILIPALNPSKATSDESVDATAETTAAMDRLVLAQKMHSRQNKLGSMEESDLTAAIAIQVIAGLEDVMDEEVVSKMNALQAAKAQVVMRNMTTQGFEDFDIALVLKCMFDEAEGAS